ncbi:MAG: metallophosphoesterase family protein [Gammaproteobacteria bacterium]
MTQTTFTIAHLSDPHLSRPEPVQVRQLLNKRILGYLSWRRRRRFVHQAAVLDQLLDDLHEQSPDHTVVTGDLTHIGLPVEFEQAKEWLARLGDPQVVTVIPGNHDTYVREAWETTFAGWEEYLAGDEDESWSANAYPSLRMRGPVAIVGVSTAVPTPWFRASGRVGRAQRERLAEMLADLAQQDIFRLALIHHAPVPGVDPWRKRLTDVRETAQVLAQGGAHLVLHGHDHTARWSSLESAAGLIPVVAVPSASYRLPAPDKRASYNLYHVRRDDSGWRVEVVVRGLRDGVITEFERRDITVPNFSQAPGVSA